MTKRRIQSIALAALFAVLILFSFFIPCRSLSVSAEATVYSDVLDDLKEDDKFDEALYPSVSNDYSLQVITIAESRNFELFVYVYQPSSGVKTLFASSINISLEAGKLLDYRNYGLNLVSQNGVFQKYVVEGLTVASGAESYYEISSIFRAWDSTIDEELDKTTENTIDEVSFKVGKSYKFTFNHGQMSMKVDDVETIDITEKYCGFVRFAASPINIFGNDYDAHFVSFVTDKRIDKLYNAKISYVSQKLNYYYDSSVLLDEVTGSKITELEEPQKTEKILTEKDTVELEIGGIGGNTYFFNRIQTVDSFLGTLDLYEQDSNISVSCNKEKLGNTEWVLRFSETDYEDNTILLSYPVYDYNYTKIQALTIMQLYFETDGVFYNLGVVDNKQTEDDSPFAVVMQVSTFFDDLWQKILELVAIVLLIFFIWSFMPSIITSLLRTVLNAIWTVIKMILKAVLWVLTLPFRLLFGLIKK